MTLGHPAGLWALALAIPVVALHVLRPARPDTPVGSTFLWHRVVRPNTVTAAKPWQRLRPSWLLAAQLAVVALVALALADPRRTVAGPSAEHTVFVVDASASMGAVDGTPNRLAAARERARELRAGLGPGARASLVVANGQPRLLLAASGDRAAFDDAVDKITLDEGPADFARAFTLARAAAGQFAASPASPAGPTGTTAVAGGAAVVLVSDGGLDRVAERLLPPGARYVRIGEADANRGISRLSLEPRGGSLLAHVTLVHYGGPTVTQTLRLDVDGTTAARVEVTLAPGQVVEREVSVPPGERVEATLEGEDLLAADNRAVAVAPHRRGVRVLLVGPANPFLDKALEAIGGLTIERTASAAALAAAATGTDPGAAGPPVGSGFDLAIFDRVEVPATVGAPVLAIAPPGGFGPVHVEGAVPASPVVAVDSGEPTVAGLDFSEMFVSSGQRVRADVGGAVAALSSVDAPLYLRGETGGLPFAYFAFPLGESNLGVQVAFPILLSRLIDALSGVTPPGAGLTVGDPVPVQPGVEATVRLPGNRTVRVAPGDAAPVADRAGFARIEIANRPATDIAVNPAPSESAVLPRDSLNAPAGPAGAGGAAGLGSNAAAAGAVTTSLLRWLAPLIVALVVAAGALAWRQRGVGPVQGALLVAGHVAVVALVATALVDPRAERPARRLATVFLVDQSDSLGPAGRAAAQDFVRKALGARQRGEAATVVVFGGDATIERVFSDNSSGESQANDPIFGEATNADGPIETVDASRTDLAGALRLGAALLPTDARRRAVLISDGRPTVGDERAAAEELATAGIRLDVATVSSGQEGDVAIAALTAPSAARAGEQETVRAVVVADRAGEADVVLRRDGEVVAAQRVKLPAGRSEVELADIIPPATEGSMLRYRVDIGRPGDPVAQNDTAYAGVRVEGPAKVLVVEGAAGEGASLAAALQAGGLRADVVTPAALPPLDQLSTYAASILVNVDARTLAPEQVAALGAAVRDLGRGMVTIGGPRAYGPGGYRNSSLEDLLPVVSELTDPVRQRRVAEVLAIDTSGSMGSCHCSGAISPGLTQNRVFGGVNKTDISRSSAARSIESLRPNDEIGLLAITNTEKWVIDLQQVPSQEFIDRGLKGLRPDGATDLSRSLRTAATRLRTSKAPLKHVILFTDGFSRPGTLVDLAKDAAALRAEGITTSIVATGEGADMALLESIAVAGGGRFYAGKDLSQIPNIIVDETVATSRQFINEGQFVPLVTSEALVVRNLVATPPLLGYIATSAKPAAQTHLRIGPEEDPLLASWQLGIGRVTSWASDAGSRWSQLWQSWDGYVGFWNGVVKDVLPTNEAPGAVTATVSDGSLKVRVESSTPWAEGASATARVAGPDGQSAQVPLQRVADNAFEATVPAEGVGTWAVGASVGNASGALLTVATTASSAYSAEYAPGVADPVRLARLAERTGGRAEVDPAAAFDAAGLADGVRHASLRWWWLLAAALAWPLVVALSRVPAGDVGRALRAAAGRVAAASRGSRLRP